MDFKKGFYVYVGSAMNSLLPRLKRHLSREKKTHWHIDYFLRSENTEIIEIIFTISEKRAECEIAQKLTEIGMKVDGFGSSDCSCSSHLFYFQEKNDGLNTVSNAFRNISLEIKTIKDIDKL